MWNTWTATCSSRRMRKTILLLLLSALWAEMSHQLPSQEVHKKEAVLTRSKRRWVLSTIDLEEELPGPYPRTFTALYNDKHLNHSIIFKISGQGVTEEPKGVFSINENTGELFIHKAIDREIYPVLNVKFDVLDKESYAILDKTLSFSVAIKDKNDNPPTFIPEVLNVNIPENTKEGQLPVSLQARDIDEEGTDNSRVSMRIVSQEPALPKISLDSMPDVKTSVTKLTFNGCFDYDKVRKYKLLVEARDHGTPSLSSTMTVNIQITDSNTHLPVFTAPKFNAQVMEREYNKEILRIPVQDQDTPNTPASRAVFTILKGNEDGNYKIETDPLTNEGVLTIIKPKDYEITALTELEIGVENEVPLFLCVDGKPARFISENLKRNTGKVAVRVIDVNDPPVFQNPIYKIYRVEEEEPGEVLYTPTVTDEDSDPAKLRYALVQDPAKWMSIDPQTGKISLAKKMDRESPYVNDSTYTVVMHAVDDANPPGTGTGTLVVKLGDKNDNAPNLTRNRTLICGNKADRVQVTAVDADNYPYGGPFTYTLGEDADHETKSTWKFEQRGTETFLISPKSLPYGNYSVPLTVADQQGVQAHDVLEVVVCDCGNGTVCKDLLPRYTTLHGAAIGIFLGALILMSLLLCFCFICKYQKRNFKQYVQDDGIQTLIKYNEEGGGARCQDSNMLPPKFTTQSINGNCHGVNTERIQLTQVPNGAANTTDLRSGYAKSSTWTKNRDSTIYSATRSGITRSHSLMSEDNMKDHLERRLYKLAMGQVNLPEHPPHEYGSEGSVTHAASLDNLSFHNAEGDMNFLHHLGPKFRPLGDIVQHRMEERRMKL